MASPSQPKSLIFDLEVAPGKADKPDRIFMVGALRIIVKVSSELLLARSRPYALGGDA
ncbi:hypothetical protein [Stutzerimonas zhaodongensis]|jgi:hypothetical protein|uniref:hypothetical protein n=1 Tax=Stutzerimonas zhaodongensis TaxID=1176257 RepID=UPI001F4D7202|nr:hypothetical protein [Stutzerimonas zhaodongensis]UNG20240.1 hypothetical protein MKP10_08430 [Stutzerimonas zhaodongensis]